MTLSELSKEEYVHIKPGIERIKNFLESVNINPNTLPIVHIAGTNAKGSVASFLGGIFIKSKLKTGLYTSPHLLKINERIKINDSEINERNLRNYYMKYYKKFKSLGLTFFEVMTAVAVIHFLEEGVEVAVMEVGVGGTFDATNVCQNKLVSIITTVDYDHTDLFGKNIFGILREDIGIIKAGAPVVIGKMRESLKKRIRASASKKSSKVYELDRDFSGVFSSADWKNSIQKFDFKNPDVKMPGLKIKLMGTHQTDNAAISVQAALLCKKKYPKINTDAVYKGLLSATWPGRFEVKKYMGNAVIIDGAHNPQAAKTFVDEYLRSPFKKNKARVIFSALREKDYRNIIKEVAKISERIYLFKLKTERMADIQGLKTEFSKYIPSRKIAVVSDLRKTLATRGDSPFVFTGSLYLAAEAINIVE